MVAALLSLAALLASAAPQRVLVPEGWYRVEEGYGESADGEIFIAVDDDEDAAPADAPIALPLPAASPVRRAPDCEEIRGRYLQRLLELHGVDAFALEPRALAAWTHRPPSGWPFVLDDPALAPLWGLPPVPPGALGYDLTLRELARELLSCDGE